MKARYWIISGAALVLCACNAGYIYHPAENATAQIRGHVAADYQIPTNDPKGDVRIASFGISKITPESRESLRAIHARLVVSNNGVQPWLVDIRQQVAALPGGQQVHPAFARSDSGEFPIVRVAPRGKGTIDLFFPLPADAQRASKLPEFDVVWYVNTGQQMVSERTPFERLAVEPAYAYGWGYPYGPGWGYGPYAWYDPFWGPAMIGAPGWYW
jgi:hypothetical protein